MAKSKIGDYENLPQALKDRHDKSTNALNKLTSEVLNKLSGEKLRSLLDNMLLAEAFSLRITRPLHIEKIKLVCRTLESKGIYLNPAKAKRMAKLAKRKFN